MLLASSWRVIPLSTVYVQATVYAAFCVVHWYLRYRIAHVLVLSESVLPVLYTNSTLKTGIDALVE